MSLNQQNKDNKSLAKYYNPYRVLQRIGSMDYKLYFSPYSHVHPILHVSCLKKVIKDETLVETILPNTDKEGKIILKPEGIIETYIKKL